MSDGALAVGVFGTRVEWIDTDASGIYHNSTVTRYVEAAEARLMADRGVDGYFPASPRARYEVDFEAPLRFGQDVVTVVRLEHVGTASMSFAFEVWGEAHQGQPRRRAATGRYVTVHVEADDDGRPPQSAPWPAAWRDALGAGSARGRVDAD